MEFKYVKQLKDVTKRDFLLVGGKAANLGEMLQADLPVPGGFVVLTNAYKRFVEANKLEAEINRLIEVAKTDDFQATNVASEKVKEAFEKGEIPADVQAEVEAIYSNIGNPEVAIRSSATAEDLPGISFAGQYNTYLNVRGKEQVYLYLKKCWASLWNTRAVSYRIKQNIGNDGLAHGVAVQKLISADRSGILFTANPVNGRRDQILINSSWGLGEAVVGGDVTPDQWVVDKETCNVIEETIAEKKVMTVKREHGIELVDIPEKRQKQSSLKDSEVQELCKLAIAAEKYFQEPQDIEWAYMGGTLYLVQTRPITSLFPVPEQRADRRGLRIYINANLYSQAMKEPFTPMGGYVIKSMLEGLVNRYGRKNYKGDRLWWYKNVGGRIYVDMTEILATEKGVNKLKNNPSDKDPVTTKALLQVLARNEQQVKDSAQGFSTLGKLNWRVMKLLASSMRRFFHGVVSPQKARIKAVNTGEQIIQQLKTESKKLKSMEEKLRFIESKSTDLFVEGFGIVLYVAVSSTYIDKAKKIMEKYLGDTKNLYDVEKSVPYSVTTEMGMELLEIAKKLDRQKKRATTDEFEVERFLDKYGHRASIELDVGAVTWKEEPQYVLDLINSYIDSKTYNRGIENFVKGKVEAEAAIQNIKKRLIDKGYNKKAKEVEKMLVNFREMFGIREQSKFFVRQFLTIFKRVLTEVGEELVSQGRLKQASDIFYVTVEDIRSDKDLKLLVYANKEEYQREFNRNAPKVLTSTGESVFAPIEESDGNSLSGVAVSPGVYEGKVRVLHHPEEGHKVEKGEILVTIGTNPSWTPLFLKLGALIMETGGPISHGSVVAREYGVPAVAGVANAATVLKDGQLVRVNGETGRVDIL
ncbi:PEP/pyruvate-binding domain-containing protein [Desulfuribacillus alkaliarsenatis]|uniref:Phosphoenolpyruvate synthase n=1 Tax=Desulfuribacillus alkaliarsenatis TaxID=766136 RepID=A0A1E5G2J1_9FIRM|nr:PEP/pyruvate-binding domain-containing protein [Desulfuribacillus alkaliarsenatis]OEF97103.1 hypothetical protein BHF68_05765 [Desulfuribacillus alkaliarsenatis]